MHIHWNHGHAASMPLHEHMHCHAKLRQQSTARLMLDVIPYLHVQKMQIFVFVRAEYLSPNGKLNQVVLWDSIIQQKVWTGQGVLCSIMTLHPLITGAMP